MSEINRLLLEDNYPEALVLADEALNLNPDKDEAKIIKGKNLNYLSKNLLYLWVI